MTTASARRASCSSSSAGVVLLGILSDGPGLGALLVVGAVAYLVARERREPRPASYDSSDDASYASAYDAQHGPVYGPVPPPLDDPTSDAWVERPRRPRRRRSPLGAMVLSVATLVTGVLLALRLSGVDAITTPRVLAVALLVVGGGLLVGAWVGRARWLIAVGLVLALALGASVAARGTGLDDGFGERTWTPERRRVVRPGRRRGRARPLPPAARLDARRSTSSSGSAGCWCSCPATSG